MMVSSFPLRFSPPGLITFVIGFALLGSLGCIGCQNLFVPILHIPCLGNVYPLVTSPDKGFFFTLKTTLLLCFGFAYLLFVVCTAIGSVRCMFFYL